MVRHGDVLVLAIAVYCGHTPTGPNQYFDLLHLQGTSTTNTAKRVQAHDPCEGAACQHIVKKKKLTKDEGLREAKELTKSTSGLDVQPLETQLEVRWEVLEDDSSQAPPQVVW